MKPNVQPVDANQVVAIAERIGHCDFRVTVSRYCTGNGRPWVITVGENAWQRHLVVEEIYDGGADARLGILPLTQTEKSGYDLHTNEIERNVMLLDLVAGSYSGVKEWLLPKGSAFPRPQRHQLAADIADSQSN
jgi:hypothetical protein